jgi:hypothetical protein
MYWGTGVPGPLDPATPNRGAISAEALVNEDSIDFATRLQSLDIPARLDAYGPGTHSWPYWARDLRQSIGPLMEAFAHPPAIPRRITYTTAEARYTVYGWSVITHRTAAEFSTLAGAGPEGFALAGSGSATVVTPARYVPGARYRIGMRGRLGSSSTTIVAGRSRRLRIGVPLGPANPFQQYTAEAALTGTAVFTTRVSIVRVRRQAGRR